MSSLEKREIRVRMAPSPTGWLHLGTARTALFNWLFAKKTNGKFVIRIEDTDVERSKKEYEEDILKGLKWLGLDWDEGPDVGGEYGPYRQSERTDIYRKYLQKLLDEGKAYFCFCSKEELEAERKAMEERGAAPRYGGKCREMSQEEAFEKSRKGENCVIRIKNNGGVIDFHDMIRGKISVDSGILGDFVIARNIDSPLYLFAVVVDDYEMKISNVIRGEDHISNTPKQIMIQKALGFDEVEYAHLPLILAPDRSKLSKRSMETSLNSYKDEGYLPEAIINFLAYLGWHPKDDKEIMSSEEMIEEFEISRVQKGGAVFNIEKLDWLNAQYIKNMDISVLILQLKGFVPAGWLLDEKMFERAVEIEKDRIKKLSDFYDTAGMFFEIADFEKELLIWKDASAGDIKNNLQAAKDEIEKLPEDDFGDTKKIEEWLMIMADSLSGGGGRGQFLWPLRVALSGNKNSPSPFELIYVLGKEEAIKRIDNAIKILRD